jgi:hypothetical protein
MPKYRVTFYRLVKQTQEVEIEADSFGKAEQIVAGMGMGDLEEGDWEWEQDYPDEFEAVLH